MDWVVPVPAAGGHSGFGSLLLDWASSLLGTRMRLREDQAGATGRIQQRGRNSAAVSPGVENAASGFECMSIVN